MTVDGKDVPGLVVAPNETQDRILLAPSAKAVPGEYAVTIGEQTFPLSCLVVKRGGMVVFCAGTTGFNLTFDARYVWMRQKRIQGSHFAHLKQAAAANRFVIDRRVDPCMSEVFPWDKIPLAHTKMWKNQHAPGNMAVLVNAPTTGLRSIEDVIAAGKKA